VISDDSERTPSWPGPVARPDPEITQPSLQNPDVPPAPEPTPISDDHLRLAEALIFASAQPVTPRALGQLLPEDADPEAILSALKARYEGRGVELVETGPGVMFRTAPDLASRLRKVIEVPRRLPRAAMETLAIIAYHQPITRAEIEAFRGATLAQQTLDSLLEAGLIAPKGRRETPGRPTLWGTTPAFLSQFGLTDLRELPRREDLLVEPPSPVAEASADPPVTSDEDPASPTGEPHENPDPEPSPLPPAPTEC
jgi:segregation and condensation protein B